MSSIVDSPEVLADLDDQQYRAVIDEFLFPRGDQAWPDLLVPEVAQRTYDTLYVMLVEVNSELSARAADLETFRQQCWQRGLAGRGDWFAGQAEHQDWRRRAIRFKQAVERRMRQAKTAVKTANVANTHGTQLYRRGVKALALAVAAHRAATLADDITPEPHDAALWAALEQVEVPHEGGTITVGELIDRGAWRLGRQQPAST